MNLVTEDNDVICALFTTDELKRASANTDTASPGKAQICNMSECYVHEKAPTPAAKCAATELMQKMITDRLTNISTKH